MAAAESAFPRRQALAGVALAAAACGGLLLSGGVPLAIPVLTLLGLAFKALVFDLRGRTMPLWALTPLHALLVGAFVWLTMLHRPPMDFLQALLTFAPPLLLFRCAHPPTPFNGFLVFLISLLLVVGCAAVTSGLLPVAITGIWLVVACQALPVLAIQRAPDTSGVRVRLVGRAGGWRRAPTWATHHLALLALLLGGALYLFVPRIGADAGAGEAPDAPHGAAMRSRTGSGLDTGRTSTMQTGFPQEVRLGDIGVIKRRPYLAFRLKLLAYGKPYDPAADERRMMLLRARAWRTYDPRTRRWLKPYPERRRLPRTGTYDADVAQAPLHWDIEVLGYNAETLFLPQRTARIRSAVQPLFVNGVGAVSADAAVPRYQIESAWPVKSDRQLGALTARSADRRLLRVPAELRDELARMLPPRANRSLGASLDAIQRHFRSGFQYTLDMPESLDPGRDPILAFLDRRVGHCELFASAAVMFLRLWGFPARLAGGMRCSERLEPGTYQARMQNAHAWVEIPTLQAGFVAVDVTPPDSRARAPEGGAGNDAATADAAPERADGFDWSQPFRYGPEERQRVVDWFHGRALSTPVVATLVGLLLMGILWGAFDVARRRRRQDPLRVTARAGLPRQTLAFYAQFLRRCAGAGFVRRRAQTPREFLARLPAELREEGARVTAEFERKRYG